MLGAAKNPMIVCGGGALDASAEITLLSDMLQAPVLAYRRGRGVLDSRNPLSVTMPLGRDLWREADVVLAVGTRLLTQLRQWGVDDDIAIIRVDADPDEPARLHPPAAALIGDAAPILRRIIDLLPAHNAKRPSRHDEMTARQAHWAERLQKLAPQLAFLAAIRAELPENGIFVDEVTQLGFVSRIAMPVYRPRTFISPGFQDPLGWGYATALGVQHACPATPHPGGALRQPADRLRSRQSRLRALWGEFWGCRRTRADAGRPSRGVAARLRPDRYAHRDRGPGRPVSEPLGVHPHAANPRRLNCKSLA